MEQETHHDDGDFGDDHHSDGNEDTVDDDGDIDGDDDSDDDSDDDNDDDNDDGLWTWQYCNAAAARLISPPQQTMQLHTWNNIDEKYFYLKCNSGDAGQNKDAKFVVSEICLICVGNLKPNTGFSRSGLSGSCSREIVTHPVFPPEKWL